MKLAILTTAVTLIKGRLGICNQSANHILSAHIDVPRSHNYPHNTLPSASALASIHISHRAEQANVRCCPESSVGLSPLQPARVRQCCIWAERPYRTIHVFRGSTDATIIIFSGGLLMQQFRMAPNTAVQYYYTPLAHSRTSTRRPRPAPLHQTTLPFHALSLTSSSDNPPFPRTLADQLIRRPTLTHPRLLTVTSCNPSLHTHHTLQHHTRTPHTVMPPRNTRRGNTRCCSTSSQYNAAAVCRGAGADPRGDHLPGLPPHVADTLHVPPRRRRRLLRPLRGLPPQHPRLPAARRARLHHGPRLRPQPQPAHQHRHPRRLELERRRDALPARQQRLVAHRDPRGVSGRRRDFRRVSRCVYGVVDTHAHGGTGLNSCRARGSAAAVPASSF